MNATLVPASSLGRLAGSDLGSQTHICAFFNGTDDYYQTLLPFMVEGFPAGDRAFHIVDGARQHDHRLRLIEAGIPLDQAEAAGQIEIRNWEDAHLRSDHFDQRAMLALIQDVLPQARSRGYRLTRFVANMEWGLTGLPGVEDIVEYESRLNEILPNFPDPVICTYDLDRFSARIVIDIMRVHPLVIVAGMLHENPFYVPPSEFVAS
jgi:hypothetical protein